MIKSFKYAYQGIVWAWQEPTFRILLVITLIVLLLMVVFRVTLLEAAILILTIAMVLSFELLNSQVERTLNIIKVEQDERIGQIKDMAAATVLLASIGAAAIGLLIFLPRLIALFFS